MSHVECSGYNTGPLPSIWGHAATKPTTLYTVEDTIQVFRAMRVWKGLIEDELDLTATAGVACL